MHARLDEAQPLRRAARAGAVPAPLCCARVLADSFHEPLRFFVTSPCVLNPDPRLGDAQKKKTQAGEQAGAR